MKDLQKIISEKSENESNLKADQAGNEFIKGIHSEFCSEYIDISSIANNSKVNLVDIVKLIVKQQKPKLAKKLIEKRTQEFYDKVNNIQSQLDDIIGEIE